jgi:hypothetical protein
MKMFDDLTPEREAEFKDWARANYKPLTAIKGVWHPVTQAECVRMNDEMFGRGAAEGDPYYGATLAAQAGLKPKGENEES